MHCKPVVERYAKELGFSVSYDNRDTAYLFLEGNEKSVSICAKDGQLVYDYQLINRLIDCAKKAEIPYAVDVYYRYSSDANAVRTAGNDVRAALFGMAVYGSHGRERTHIDGLLATSNLILAYILNS